MDFTFIHAADLHLDSPMKGLVGISASEDQETASFLQSITRKAFENLIETALREPVDLVLIAGDLFDGTWNDFSSGLWAARQMERLCRQDIPCCLVLGNHDRLNRMISRIPWPENVHLFASDHADEFRLEEAKVVVHGRSFPSQFCREDLTLDFSKATPGYFHIGLLHTEMGNDNQDGTYAPTNIDQLNSRQYDYWALGHVHQRQTVQRSPCWVGYPGVLQGRHIRESGAKGFYLVRLSNGRVVDSEFIESDVLRWFVREIDLTGVGDEEQFWERLQECFDRTRQENPDRMSVLRLIFKGRTSLCREWSVADRQKNLNMEIRERAALSGFRIQIEEIHWRISVPEKKNFSQTAGILGELFRALEERQDFFRQLVPSGDTDGRIEADGESGIEKVIGTD
ncbi:MAG: exonuclease SbcCD subunit D, partial [Thermoguttaceae bacterium]|nr:exonuclease SbcCD subunit D [Thermoguttaceae bacterium]